MIQTRLNGAGKALLRAPNIAHIATVGLRAAPHVTPVWIDFEGEDVIFNTAEGRQKVQNLRRNPAVTVSVLDPADPWKVLVVQGRAVEITSEGADDHINELAKKYLNLQSYPFRQPGEQRLKVRIRPQRLLMQPPEEAA
ncbi:MAG: PPOX class F420-dependent oxidoreductase [Actinomycetota bacterium]